MTTELLVLTMSILLGFVHIILSSHTASLQRGYRWAASARDEPTPPLTGIAGRLDRALRNYLETFPFFAAAVLLAHAVGQHNTLTVFGAHFYFWARIVYFALYAMGLPLIRSLIWNVATLGIILILVGLV
jgi:uncharacterized MAPEG superfamily protein